MKFNCEFFNPDSEEIKEIVITLSAAECDSVNGLREHEGF